MLEDEASKAQGGLDSDHRIAVNGGQQTLTGCFTVRTPGNELGQHRVVVHRNLLSLAHPVVDADSRACWPTVDFEHPGVWSEVVGHVLGIHSQLNGVAVELKVLLAVGQSLATGDANLFRDQIQTCNLLGHRMLDL